MRDELISVIVPVYRVEKYLDRCVNSISGQTYNNLEIILVDDGSDDRCPVMCDEYAARDERIHVIHKANGGQATARNAGLDAARGRLIAFVDSDDYIALDMYERLYNAMEAGEADIAICNYSYVTETGVELTKDSPIVNYEVVNCLDFCEKLQQKNSGYYITPWNKLYRREIFDKVRFPEVRAFEDNFIIHKIAEQCRSIVIIPDKLCYYTQRAGSTSSRTFSARTYGNIDALLDRFGFYIKKSQSDLRYLELARSNATLIVDTFLEYYRRFLFHGEKTHDNIMASREIRNKLLRTFAGNEDVTSKEQIRRLRFPLATIITQIIRERI